MTSFSGVSRVGAIVWPHLPMLFPPTVGAAITASYWYLWIRCPACRTTQSVDLRTLRATETEERLAHL